MLSFCLIHNNFCKDDIDCVVIVKKQAFSKSFIVNLLRNCLIHILLYIAYLKTIYSTSVLAIKMISCFLLYQEIIAPSI